MKKKTPPAGFEPATPGLEVRCAIRCATEAERPWWDSNPQPLDPKSSALSIAPQGLVVTLPKSIIYIYAFEMKVTDFYVKCILGAR